MESVVVERLSRPDVTDLLPREARVDVAALREELIVVEARKKGAAQMYARGTIDAEQLETITAETDQAIGKIRAQQSAATARSPLADFAATEDARRTWEDLTEQMSEELAAAQDRAARAEERAQAAEADRDVAVAQAQADADARISAAGVARDTAVAQAQARAQRAEQQADAYRAELDRLRAGSPDPEPSGHPAKAARRGTRAQGHPASRCGPATHGTRQVVGGPERQGYIDELARTVRSLAASGPFFPGDGLTHPPAQPEVMPYKPYGR